MESLLHGELSLKTVKNHENEGRAGRGAQASDAASPVQPPQPMLLPYDSTLLPERPAPRRIADGCRLHARLDRVGGEEEEVVRDTTRGSRQSLLP